MKRWIHAATSTEKWSERMEQYFHDKKSQAADDWAMEAVVEEAHRTFQSMVDKAVRIANKQLPADKELKVHIYSDGALDVGTVNDVGYDFVDDEGNPIPYDNEFELADELVKFVHEVFM